MSPWFWILVGVVLAPILVALSARRRAGRVLDGRKHDEVAWNCEGGGR